MSSFVGHVMKAGSGPSSVSSRRVHILTMNTPTAGEDQGLWKLYSGKVHTRSPNTYTAKLLLSRGASITDTTALQDGGEAHVTALHTACSAGATSIARLLIEDHQADIEAKDHLGQTPVS